MGWNPNRGYHAPGDGDVYFQRQERHNGGFLGFAVYRRGEHLLYIAPDPNDRSGVDWRVQDLAGRVVALNLPGKHAAERAALVIANNVALPADPRRPYTLHPGVAGILRAMLPHARLGGDYEHQHDEPPPLPAYGRPARGGDGACGGVAVGVAGGRRPADVAESPHLPARRPRLG